MQPTSKIFPLEGVIQHYSWGGQRFLPGLLGKINSTGQPYAEYWMGAHENAPSKVVLPDGSREPLDKFIRELGNAALGEAVKSKFGRLPYLFKVLDVNDMLSIQVHPLKTAAELEFAEENRKGIPLKTAARNYNDDNHKPELMFALSEFWLLHGFKNPSELENILNAVPELGFLLPHWKHGGYEAIYRQVMEMDQQEVNKILSPLMDRILPLYESGKLRKEEEDFWAAKAYKTFCKDGVIDRGIFSIYFFNVVHLQPGQAIFQDAGILHAYLEGQNIELMANSDNVLRGGLTEKKVDVAELLKHVKFEAVEPAIISAEMDASGEESFKTTAEDFELRRIIFENRKPLVLNSNTTDIFFVAEGSINVSDSNTALLLSKGDAMLSLNGAKVKFVPGEQRTVVYRATVPD